VNDLKENPSEDDLAEALRALDSTIAKCRKALPKLKPGTASHTLLTRRIKGAGHRDGTLTAGTRPLTPILASTGDAINLALRGTLL
jgi:hypothetical protein